MSRKLRFHFFFSLDKDFTLSIYALLKNLVPNQMPSWAAYKAIYKAF